MEFWTAHPIATLGDRWTVLRRHELFNPEWCLAKVTDGRGRRQLDQLLRDEFARPGFNSVFEYTVVAKEDAGRVAQRFAEIGHADRLILRLLPDAPRA
ncbi:hypothetical protein I6J39_26405 [Streptomyces californicus]|uniref:Uncharacterized protein n=1 Tax=Streptomyces californicus TaxID=67351 RepID=A0ABX7J6V4_9ACTN|nr:MULTISPECIES: hypothetical protein [Streptomyces]QRV30434.1 hypothetical protein I6J39_26405 [Streptomyces californicus]QRV43849.1 hypothetical protein I6J41_26335 [Streptomyces californicus]